MSVSFNYTTLTQALQAWSEDSYEDFTGSLDEMIGLAETRVIRDLDLAVFAQVDGNEVTVAETPTITLADQADGAFMLKELWVNGVFCEPRTEAFVYHYDDITSSGQPLYWCQVTAANIRLAPRPDAAYSTRQRVLRRPTGLSSSNATSWIGTNAGDLLFAACMAEVERFDKAPEDEAVQDAIYQRLLPQARDELRLLWRRDYAPARQEG